MSGSRGDIAKAEADVAASRQRLTATLARLQSRLTPAALKRDAVDKLKQIGTNAGTSGIDAVKRNPLPVIGVAAAILAFIARKPILRLFRRKDPATVKPRKD